MRPRKHDRHLPACMYFKHGAYWYVKRGVWDRLAKDLPTALAEYSKRIEPRSGGGMADLIDRVLKHIAPTIKPSTYKQYVVAANKLKPIMVEFAPDQVRPRDVAAIKNHMSDTPNMANRVLSFLRIVFNYAVEWQLVEVNPCVGVRRFRETKRDRLITDDEFRAIRSAAKHKATPIVMDLCHLTGQRIGDVLRIRNSDITADGIAFTQQKTGARLVVTMTPELQSVLDHARSVFPADQRAATLLYTRGFRPYSYKTIYDAFCRAAEAAGIEDAAPNDLRAKSLTAADLEGLSAQTLGGHTTDQQTRRYIRHRKPARAHSPKLPAGR